MSILDHLDGLYDRVVEHRHRRRVVLWGGRPGRDLQIGSAEDVRRQQRLNGLTAIPRAMAPFLVACRAMSRELARVADLQARALRAAGISLSEAINAQRTRPGTALADAVAADRNRRAGIPATVVIARLHAADKAARASIDRPPRHRSEAEHL